jgi:glycosyltransferase involved in cell wall biosynthesis
MSSPLLSIVVPVYKEEKNIPEFLKRLRPIIAGITEDYEVIFSLDPSPDLTEQIILEHRATDARIKLLKFSRRFGQPMATLAGLEYSRGAAVIVMDVDLQDPPELIHQLVAKWREGYEVVYAKRRNREGEPWLRTLVARLGYWVIQHISEVDIPENTGDFRLMSRRVVQEVNRLKECHGFLRGLVALVGFRQTSVLFDRPARFAGNTNYPVIGSIRIGLNGLLCFSTTMLRLSSIMGFAVAGLSLLMAFTYVALKLLGFNIIWGNPTLVILVTFLGGIQLISVGILGEYIGRIYEEVRARPKYIVDSESGFDRQTVDRS